MLKQVSAKIVSFRQWFCGYNDTLNCTGFCSDSYIFGCMVVTLKIITDII